jgi:hypothetical protein
LIPEREKWQKDRSEKAVMDVNKSELVPPRGVEDIRSVKSVYVDNFGTTEAAFLVQEKLINRLSTRSSLAVAASVEDADSLLAGFVGTSVSGMAKASVFRLLGKAGKILWAGEYGAGMWGSASSHMANKVADDILNAVKKQK